MRRHRSLAAAVIVLAACLTPAVCVGIPVPACSVLPAAIVASPDGSLLTRVVVLDLICNPMENSDVVFDFSRCAGFAPCATPCHGCVVNEHLKTVRMLANRAGVADFDLRFGAMGCPDLPAVRIYVNGVLVGTRGFASLDQDGDGSVTAADVASVHARLGTADARADFDGDGVVTATDEALVLAHLGTTCLGPVRVHQPTWGALKQHPR